MQIEWLIFFYIGVSVAMALFDLVFAAFERTRDRRFLRKTEAMAVFLGDEIERNADFPTPEHQRELVKNMEKLADMESFDLTMERLCETDAEKAERYLRGIAPVFVKLADVYAQKRSLNKAYYAYIVRRWYRERPASPKVVTFLLHGVEGGGTVFLRQNAFEAASALGDAEAMARAVLLMDAAKDFHHPKLITETMLAFAGDKAELSRLLMQEMGELSPSSKAAVVNFLRMGGRGDRRWILDVLVDEESDRELRLACVRYFMTNPWEEAARPLKELAASSNPAYWEFSSVATSALASYPGEDTVAVLKGLLASPWWHTRRNAAKSLYDLGVSIDEELADVMGGDDRYAQEMVSYRWEYERNRAGKEGSV